MLSFKPDDVERIVKDNVRRVKGTTTGGILMPDDIIKVMSLSIYESIQRYHEYASKESIRLKK